MVAISGESRPSDQRWGGGGEGDWGGHSDPEIIGVAWSH